MIVYKNKKYKSVKAFCEKVDLNPKTVSRRLREGMTPEEIVKLNPKKKEVFYNVKGKKMTIREIAEKYDMSKSTIVTRIKNGWSMDKIISTPVRKKHRPRLKGLRINKTYNPHFADGLFKYSLKTRFKYSKIL